MSLLKILPHHTLCELNQDIICNLDGECNSYLINKIIQELNSRVSNADLLIEFLKTNACVISGSFIMQCFLNENYKSDIDIYMMGVSTASITNLAESMKRRYSFRRSGGEYIDFNNGITQLCGHTIDNVVDTEFDTYFGDFIKRSESKIQFIMIKNQIDCPDLDPISSRKCMLNQLLKVPDNFDIKNCGNKFYYDPEPKLETVHLSKTFKRELVLNHDLLSMIEFLEFEHKLNTTIERIVKYSKRGFYITDKESVLFVCKHYNESYSTISNLELFSKIEQIKHVLDDLTNMTIDTNLDHSSLVRQFIRINRSDDDIWLSEESLNIIHELIPLNTKYVECTEHCFIKRPHKHKIHPFKNRQIYIGPPSDITVETRNKYRNEIIEWYRSLNYDEKLFYNSLCNDFPPHNVDEIELYEPCIHCQHSDLSGSDSGELSDSCTLCQCSGNYRLRPYNESVKNIKDVLDLAPEDISLDGFTFVRNIYTHRETIII